MAVPGLLSACLNRLVGGKMGILISQMFCKVL